MLTRYGKDYRGNWNAETVIKLPNDLRLKINTSKVHTGELVSHATVCKVERGFEVHKLYDDFSSCIDRNKVRCTEKNVKAQHDRALTYLDQIMPLVYNKYNLEPIAA